MPPTPPPDPGRDDEVLKGLAWLEKFLLRIIEGVFVFFFHRIPKWIYQVIKGCLEHLWEYLERLFRIVVRLGRVLVLTGVLIAVVVGPGVALYYSNAPPAALLVWIGLIVCALLFALQRRVWKEYQRRKRERATRIGRQPVCGNCLTAHPGPVAPAVCSFCNEKWIGVEV